MAARDLRERWGGEVIVGRGRTLTVEPLRLLVMTTNDNLSALRSYQRAGFHLAELRTGAIEQARVIKPSIPATGNDDIPIRDEIGLVLDLTSS
jgi:hypothetical protein